GGRLGGATEDEREGRGVARLDVLHLLEELALGGRVEARHADRVRERHADADLGLRREELDHLADRRRDGLERERRRVASADELLARLLLRAELLRLLGDLA